MHSLFDKLTGHKKPDESENISSDDTTTNAYSSDDTQGVNDQGNFGSKGGDETDTYAGDKAQDYETGNPNVSGNSNFGDGDNTSYGDSSANLTSYGGDKDDYASGKADDSSNFDRVKDENYRSDETNFTTDDQTTYGGKNNADEYGNETSYAGAGDKEDYASGGLNDDYGSVSANQTEYGGDKDDNYGRRDGSYGDDN